MDFKEFCVETIDQIRNYLPEQYQQAEIVLQDMVKQSDQHMKGLIIRTEGELITPCVYLNQFFEQYENGRPLQEILTDIAEVRTQAAVPEREDLPKEFQAMIQDYNLAKEHLQVRLCDPKRNRERLERVSHTIEGDFAATYHLVLDNLPEIKTGAVALNRDILMNWGVPLKTVKEDALQCERRREPTLLNINDMMSRMGFPFAQELSEGHGNLLMTEADIRLNDTLYVLTNADGVHGAALLLQDDIMAKISELAGGDYYVLPSSAHEVLIVPDHGNFSINELSEMVKSVNETQVGPEDFLSDEVQYYDAEQKLLVNAKQHEMEKSQEMLRTHDMTISRASM